MKVVGPIGRLGVVTGLALAAFGLLACGEAQRESTQAGLAGMSSNTPGIVVGVSGSSGGPMKMEGDDGIDCTLDKCNDAGCEHIPRHFMCESNELCTYAGCAGMPCIGDFQCEVDDPCIRSTVCTFSVDGSFCTYFKTDADHDGAYSVACGGNDCNDQDKDQTGPVPEVCDGKDNDCDGEVDPPAASGCLAPLICAGGKCGCPDNCANENGCFDLSSDEKHCGKCAVACITGETCTAGQCVCPDGQMRCGFSCVDTKTDANNCGQCGVACGSAECSEGACACGAEKADCDSGARFDCRALAIDPAACGSCGKQCLPASACATGDCDAEPELVKLYGGGNAIASASQLALGPNGSIYAALAGAGDYQALPDGQASLWAGSALVKFDANADFVWAVPVNAAILAVEPSGSDVWLALRGEVDVQVGQSNFALAAPNAGLGLLVKLNGTTGAVLDSHRFELDRPPATANLLIGNGGIWVAFQNLTSADYLGVTSTQPTEWYYSALFRVGTPTPRWLPGSVLSLAFDDNDRLVVSVFTPGFGSSFTFGGETFTNGKAEQSAGARYAQDLKHEASFMLPYEESVYAPAFPLGSNILFLGGSSFLRIYDFTGKPISAKGTLPFSIEEFRMSGGLLMGHGRTPDKDQIVEGRNFEKTTSYFALLDPAALNPKAIDKALTVKAATSASMPTGISGFATDATNGTLFLSVSFDGTFQLGDKTYGQAGHRGVAFVRLKLRQP